MRCCLNFINRLQSYQDLEHCRLSEATLQSALHSFTRRCSGFFYERGSICPTPKIQRKKIPPNAAGSANNWISYTKIAIVPSSTRAGLVRACQVVSANGCISLFLCNLREKRIFSRVPVKIAQELRSGRLAKVSRGRPVGFLQAVNRGVYCRH